MLIKICGVVHPADAQMAAEEGAHFVGIIFHPSAARRVTVEDAVQIAREARLGGAEPVGVFVDQGFEEIERIVQVLDLKIVQLHGARARAARPFLSPSLRVIAAIKEGECVEEQGADFILFDSAVPGSGQPGDRSRLELPHAIPSFIAGGLTPENVGEAIVSHRPTGVDVSTGVTAADGLRKDRDKVRAFIRAATSQPRRQFAQFGGTFVPELLLQPLRELEEAFESSCRDPVFLENLEAQLAHYAGRPTPLTEVPRLAERVGLGRVFLKREDLLHTGAHKLNNALGQVLLAKAMGKSRVVAETGAGQHGVAVATVCARLGMECVIYMGVNDVKRQMPNVKRMQLLGARVVSVPNGDGTLKEAISEALRDWSASFPHTAFCLGSALGPHPYPSIVRSFQAVIGREAHQQILDRIERLPDAAVACVGGGSNAIGLFSAFLDHPVRLIGVEAGGTGGAPRQHAARFLSGSPGVLHGCYTYVLQDRNGQILPTHSISAGLDYPAVGPEHAALFESGRAQFVNVCDLEAVEALQLLAATEGIIAALESSHALAYLPRLAQELGSEGVVMVNLSGRGDKDLPYLFERGFL